jgi:hypothetical protein
MAAIHPTTGLKLIKLTKIRLVVIVNKATATNIVLQPLQIKFMLL